MNIKIDWAKKKAIIEVDLLEQPATSATGETASYASVRNQPVGQNDPQGKPLKLSLQLYIKPPKAGG